MIIEDKWINFTLLNGWRIKAEVDEATGDLVLLLSNEQGNISDENMGNQQTLTARAFVAERALNRVDMEEIKAVYKLSVNE